jgi:hypothetical protein
MVSHHFIEEVRFSCFLKQEVNSKRTKVTRTDICTLGLRIMDIHGSHEQKNHVIVIQKHVSHDNARHLHSSHLEYTIVCSRRRNFALESKKCKESQVFICRAKEPGERSTQRFSLRAFVFLGRRLQEIQ